ncbi:MAG: FAD-dependent oxidoreductase [Thermoleophilaceae bacterium]
MRTTDSLDVVVVGAGPYGLACTAHLRSLGLGVHTFGEPMELWERQMPIGMFLRSSWEASSISDPAGELTLDDYEAEHGVVLPRPVPLEDYLRYGRWYQRQAVPDVDVRRVTRVERTLGGYHLHLDDGDRLRARRVVIATGPAEFARRPACFDGLAPPLVAHSSELRALDSFAGTRTAVIGAGQSAIELAALVNEAGAEVEVIARANRIRWLRRSGWLHSREGLLRQLVYPKTDVGPVGLSWLVAMPNAFRRVPHGLGDRIAYRCIRPAASAWLITRAAETRLTMGRTILSAAAAGDGVRLELDDRTTREVDRVVLGTGFEVRADRHPLLGRELLADLRTREGMPLLAAGFESSIPALHFVGAFAASSFGPVMRFVSGTPFSAPALAAHVAGARAPAQLRTRPASAAA